MSAVKALGKGICGGQFFILLMRGEMVLKGG